MDNKLWIPALLVIAFSMVPTAMADHVDDAEAAVPLSETGEANDLYVDADGPGVWEETNDHPGLQTTETQVNGRTIPADTQIV